MFPFFWALLFALFFSVFAGGATQQPPNNSSAPVQTPPAAPPQGLQAPWDIKQMLTVLNAQNQALKPLLDSMHPQQWIANGAPPAYASQYLDAQSRMDDVIRAVKNLSQQTNSLSVALDAYFRMEALEIVSRSVDECVRKYGDRGVADRLSQLLAQEFTNRQKFREYLRDLSTQREQEFKIADEEAQRCRGMISKEPLPPVDSRRTRKK